MKKLEKGSKFRLVLTFIWKQRFLKGIKQLSNIFKGQAHFWLISQTKNPQYYC